MPLRDTSAGGNASPRRGLHDPDATENPTSVTGEGSGWTKAALGAGALAATAALLRSNPGSLAKLGKGALALRSQSMLSGFAPLKSAVGNIGAGIEQAVEGKGFGALKSILSRETLDDAVQAFKNHTPAAGGTNLPFGLDTPGRIMSSLDEATNAALQRSGMSGQEATSALLQTPLPPRISKALSNPVMDYLIPFRRVPINALLEGGSKFGRAFEGDTSAIRGLATYGGAGAVHGALTADDKQPWSVGLGVAGSARYGLPYALGAMAGRTLAGGRLSGSGIADAALPMGSYGLESAFDVNKGLGFRPASLNAINRMFGGG